MRRFEARVEAVGPGGAWTRLMIPFDVADAFGTKGRVSVRGTINGFAFRTSLFPNGDGTHHMMANKAMLAGARAKPGDAVRIALEADAGPRALAAPADLARALAKDKVARAAFETLAPSYRNEFVTWIEGAKRQETRASRLERTIAMLRAGKRLKG